jgi:putative transposase
MLSHEVIRSWCYKFGPHFAQQVRQKRRSATDQWHLDEVFVTVSGNAITWREVDNEGMVLDILTQTWCNAKSCKTLFRRCFKDTGTRPRVLVTPLLLSQKTSAYSRSLPLETRSTLLCPGDACRLKTSSLEFRTTCLLE